MDELIEILARDVPNWDLIISKYKPLRIFIATSMDNKQRPMLLPERAVKLPIGELLAGYFNSASYKIMLCLACLKEETKLVDDIIEIPKKSQSKEKRKEKPSSKAKIKKKLKVKSESQDLSVVKVLFLEYITIILTVLTLFIEERELNFNNASLKQVFSF